MNSLSWMIYLADVAGSLGNMLSGALIIALIAGFGRLFFGGITALVEEDQAYWQRAVKAVPRPLMMVAGPLIVALAVLPSQSTIYAIAASEMGEDVLNSKTGGKAIKALDAWLDRQIAGEPEQGE